eukprot:CAMPEP_0178426284 /NCGR_PEP_ID=MMETSP0689_2-20121128/29157_1 /TAXON_ID=160604 /ORGANISM="Amphidinium massartii, Strain CS-259" /LENGTH=462 /DNA_ID=CAMNT_0020047969 /DNA_START=8 /DNA_END=1393 /DNA_ORIENTATION=+
MSQDIHVSKLLGLEIWLTPSQKDRLMQEADNVASGRSSRGFASSSLVARLAAAVPEALTPNMLALLATWCLGQAWSYEAAHLGDEDSRKIACGAVLASITAWQVAGRLIPAVASRTLQDTGLTHLWCFACDAVALIFASLMLCDLLGAGDATAVQSGTVQISQLIHLCTGSLVVSPKSSMGLRELLVGIVVAAVSTNLCGVQVSDAAQATLPATALTVYLGAAAFYTGCSADRSQKAASSLMVLLRLVCLFMHSPSTLTQVVEQAVLTSVLVFDLEVARLSGRSIHPWVAVMVSSHLLRQPSLVTWAMVLFYYITFFVDLSCYVNMPILAPCKNVYCDGVYDLCHMGHKNLFRNAAKLGHRLFVGVCSDKDCSNYKRPPVMNQDERAAEILHCKSVYKVIENAPCFGLKEDYIRKNRIHVVAFGEEYQERFPNPDDDPYYKVPRKMGIAVPMPRTRTISTSE